MIDCNAKFELGCRGHIVVSVNLRNIITARQKNLNCMPIEKKKIIINTVGSHFYKLYNKSNSYFYKSKRFQYMFNKITTLYGFHTWCS